MTILHRCIEAYEQGCRLDWDDDDEAPMRRTLRTLADYIRQNHYRSTGREIAILLDTAGVDPPTEPNEPHPSLTAQERNPSLR